MASWNRWTPEKEAELSRLWLVEHRTAGECAKSMGITRGAVIGKVTRLGFPSLPTKTAFEKRSRASLNGKQAPWSPVSARKEPDAGASRARPQLHGTKCKPMPSSAPVPATEPCTGNGVTLFDLAPGDCRWALWSDPGLPIALKFYCAAPAIEGTSWCLACTAKVFTPSAVLPPSLRRFAPVREVAE